MNHLLKDKIYVVASNWSYPFGGGEEFLYQTLQWALDLGMKCYWVCFSNAQNKPYEELLIEQSKYGKIIKVPGGFSKESLHNWLKILKPDLVHHQGHLRKDFYDVCKELRVEFLSGYHFWSGAIILNEETKNINILENSDKHQRDPEIDYLMDKKYCNLYTVTPFVSQCIEKVTGHSIDKHIYASSSYNKCKIPDMIVDKNKYVSMVNIHKLKGGDTLLRMIKELKQIPFLAVRTEFKSDDLDQQIKEAIEERNRLPDAAKCLFLERVSDPKIIYGQTRILLASSLVDETFCRVVNESMMNGIPVITTGQGNIKYLVGDSCPIIDINDYDKWVETVTEMYTNTDLLLEYSEKVNKQYKVYSEFKAKKVFTERVCEVVDKSKEMNVMLLTPWCDQGLGIQSRNYANILENSRYKVHVFAMKPYNGNSCLEMQKNPAEWLIDNIYYSPNCREQIKDAELIQFVNQYNIGKCLLPETCFDRVFQMAQLFESIDVKCYAIPNIEIVRKDEVFKHRYFHKILCNNHLCHDIFSKHGINNLKYIGYAICQDDQICMKPKQLENDEDELKFLFIGGMNAINRKNLLLILEAFDIASRKVDNISLTCTIQMFNLNEKEDKDKIQSYMNHPKINIIQDHLKYSDIIDLYYSHHVSVQVSKHEGLGLGFYEAINTGTPIITLNTPPHNEIVLNNVNGWVIDCYYKPMKDNKDPLFESAYFEPIKLADLFAQLGGNLDIYRNILSSLMMDYMKRIHISKFRTEFLEGINN
jgi:glycosyltransferase involved in cell wall biosynthesis